MTNWSELAWVFIEQVVLMRGVRRRDGKPGTATPKWQLD
jgi:hypothetical protein